MIRVVNSTDYIQPCRKLLKNAVKPPITEDKRLKSRHYYLSCATYYNDYDASAHERNARLVVRLMLRTAPRSRNTSSARETTPARRMRPTSRSHSLRARLVSLILSAPDSSASPRKPQQWTQPTAPRIFGSEYDPAAIRQLTDRLSIV